MPDHKPWRMVELPLNMCRSSAPREMGVLARDLLIGAVTDS